jgi:hypothetical protein
MRMATCHPSRKLYVIKDGLCSTCYGKRYYAKKLLRRKTDLEYATLVREKNKAYHAKLRLDAEIALGAECAWCGISDRRVLEIDHINNDGHLEPFSDAYLKAIRNGNRIGEFQLLCANCHSLKTKGYTKEEMWYR